MSRAHRSRSKSPISQNYRILVADDDSVSMILMSNIIESLGYEVVVTNNGTKALTHLVEEHFDLAILDIFMPGKTGLEVLLQANSQGLEIPTLIVTAHNSVEAAIEAMREGAVDYITKPIDMNAVRILLRQLLPLPKPSKEHEHKDKVDLAIETLIVSRDPSMIEVYKMIGILVRTSNEITCLIHGASGTGKETVAKQIHRWSRTASEPFIALNVTALPDHLVESELFGFEKGAFTGAEKSHCGKIEAARKGILFLDEIGSISPSVQAKLLRVLQERNYYPLGSNQLKTVDCRIICSTNEDLRTKIKSGQFRLDLYYRLNGFSIELPTLNQRISDLPLLVEYFVRKYAVLYNCQEPSITTGVIDYLSEREWPGNIRELEHSIAQAVATCKSKVITLDSFKDKSPKHRPEIEKSLHVASLSDARSRVVAAFETRYLKELLETTGSNVREASRIASVSIPRLYQLLAKYGISTKTAK